MKAKFYPDKRQVIFHKPGIIVAILLKCKFFEDLSVRIEIAAILSSIR